MTWRRSSRRLWPAQQPKPVSAIRGKLSIERADNGVVLAWYEGGAVEAHREVFVNSGALINRLDSLLDIFDLDALHPAALAPLPAEPQVEPGSPAELVDSLLPTGSQPGEE